MIKLSRSSAGSAALVISTALAAVLLLSFPEETAGGISRGLMYSAQMLIPSLFPFMLLSSFMIRSGAADILGRALSFVFSRLFRLPPAASAAVILSFIGGYPVGAGCVRTLCDRKAISSVQAEQMMMFCVCSGPAFLITGVGTLLLHSTEAGVIIYASQVISGLILGVISGRIYNRGTKRQPDKDLRGSPPQVNDPADAFIMSSRDASWSIIGLTAMVSVFTMLISVLSETGIPGLIAEFLKLLGVDACIAEHALLIAAEVTGACHEIAEGGCPLWLISAAAGFGGLCVHFQIFSILGDIKLRKSRFFLFRTGNAFLSSVIVYIVCRLRHQTAGVFAGSLEVKAELSSVSAVGAVVLVLMSAVFVMSLKADPQNGVSVRKRR